MTNFHNQDVDFLDNHISKTFEEWFLVGNICNDVALVNFMKIFAHKYNLSKQTNQSILCQKAELSCIPLLLSCIPLLRSTQKSKGENPIICFSMLPNNWTSCDRFSLVF